MIFAPRLITYVSKHYKMTLEELDRRTRLFNRLQKETDDLVTFMLVLLSILICFGFFCFFFSW